MRPTSHILRVNVYYSSEIRAYYYTDAMGLQNFLQVTEKGKQEQHNLEE